MVNREGHTQHGDIRRLVSTQDKGYMPLHQLEAETDGITSKDIDSFQKVLGHLATANRLTSESPTSELELLSMVSPLKELVELREKITPVVRESRSEVLSDAWTSLRNTVVSRREVLKKGGVIGGSIFGAGTAVASLIYGIDNAIDGSREAGRERRIDLETTRVLKNVLSAESISDWKISRPLKAPGVSYENMVGDNVSFVYTEHQTIDFRDKADKRWNGLEKEDINLNTFVEVDDHEIETGEHKGGFAVKLKVDYAPGRTTTSRYQGVEWVLTPTDVDENVEDSVVLFKNSAAPELEIFASISILDPETEAFQVTLLDKVVS